MSGECARGETPGIGGLSAIGAEISVNLSPAIQTDMAGIPPVISILDINPGIAGLNYL